MEAALTDCIPGVVLAVRRDSLLIWDRRSRQRVLVLTRAARRFARGDCVRVRFNGVMTASVPPQLTADTVTRTGCRWFF